MSYIFGPLPSRRLGLSLGVDLIPSKTCTYDCLYCEVGKTTCHTIDAQPFVSVEEIKGELGAALLNSNPDTITLAGSGEPTLNSEIDKIISFIKEKTDIKTALLTNGSLFWKQEVLEKVLAADIILPTLSTVFNDTFKIIHRPYHGLNAYMIIKGLKELRKRYRGLIFIEVILLSGINDSEKELEGLKAIVDEVSPDKIQLNTVVRPPSEHRAVAVDNFKMEKIRDFMGHKAEIICYSPSGEKTARHDSERVSVIEMAKRRPVRLVDIAQALNKTQEETEHLLKEMIEKGDVSEKKHGDDIFYIAYMDL